MSKEIKSLTGIRGVAAIVIVIHHYSSAYLHTHLLEIKERNIFYVFLYNYSNNGYLMVELFFILSGFVLALSYQNKIKGQVSFFNYREFMIKRFNRIYPLYFFITLIFFLLFNYGKYVKELGVLFINFSFLELWFPREYVLNNVSWSLCTEWFIYLIFPFLLISPLMKTKRVWNLFLFALLIFLIAPILNSEKIYGEVNYTVGDLRMSNGTGAFLRCLGSYFVGLGVFKIYKYYPTLVSKLNKYWWVILSLILIFYGFDKTDIIIDFLFGLLILSIIHKNPLSDFMSSKVIYFLGLISYSVYLNHMIFLRVFRYLSKAGFVRENFINNSLVFLFLITGTIIFSYFTYKFIELTFSKHLTNRYQKWKLGKNKN